MKRRLSLVLAFVATVMTASAWADEPSVQQIAESRAAEWNAAFARGKVDDILSLYTENAILLQPNGSVSKNLREIREFWQVLIQKGVYDMDIVTARCGDDNTIITTATRSSITRIPKTMPVNFCWRSPISLKALNTMAVDDMDNIPPRKILLMWENPIAFPAV